MTGVEKAAVIESSIGVRWLHRVAAGSLVGRFIRDRAKATHAGVKRISGAIAPLTGQRARADAEGWRIVEGSRLLTGVESMFGLIGTAWRETMTTGTLAPLARDLRALRPAERARLFGWVVFVAAVAVSVWRVLEGGVSLWLLPWVAMTLAAAALMKWNGVIATAWTHRSGTRPPNARI